MSNLWKLIAVAIGAALVACQWTPPHSSALEEARRAFKLAHADPLVVRAAPEELHQAQAALRRAELSWIDAHDEALTSHLAYLAFQRVAIARNVGLQREAEQRLLRAESESRRLLAKEAPAAEREAGTHVVPVRLAPPDAGPASAVALPPTATGETLAPATAPLPAPPRVAPKPTLPPHIQAQLAAPAKNIASRRDRPSRVAKASTPVRATPARAAAARRDASAEVKRHAQALAKASKSGATRRLAVSRPDGWYLEPQGLPHVVPPLNPPHPLHWLTSSGRLSE